MTIEYSKLMLEHFEKPRNIGVYPESEENIYTARLGKVELGFVLHLQVEIINNLIKSSKIKVYGNPFVIAALSWLSVDILEKDIEYLKNIEHTDIMDTLGFPEHQRHAAILVEDVLKILIENYELEVNG